MPEMEKLFTTRPFGEQSVYLAEDQDSPAARIYELHDSRGNATPLLGSELDSLCEWWAQERRRKAPPPPL
ncbi:MAG TPA: hypothetical protein VM327_02910 [Candidatus Thermoplasmatota archaeon]|nr:hypothetical protein [Candidatus Thermoplasmatota archaeon]